MKYSIFIWDVKTESYQKGNRFGGTIAIVKKGKQHEIVKNTREWIPN